MLLLRKNSVNLVQDSHSNINNFQSKKNILILLNKLMTINYNKVFSDSKFWRAATELHKCLRE